MTCYDSSNLSPITSPTMQSISKEALAQAKAKAPHFLAAVRASRRESRLRQKDVSLLLTLDAFYDDPFLLYACLWFAYSHGVRVIFSAPQPVRTTLTPLTSAEKPCEPKRS